MNICSRYSHLRMVNKPLNRDGKAAAPRQTQSSQFGIVCALETPGTARYTHIPFIYFFCTVQFLLFFVFFSQTKKIQLDKFV